MGLTGLKGEKGEPVGDEQGAVPEGWVPGEHWGPWWAHLGAWHLLAPGSPNLPARLLTLWHCENNRAHAVTDFSSPSSCRESPG